MRPRVQTQAQEVRGGRPASSAEPPVLYGLPAALGKQKHSGV